MMAVPMFLACLALMVKADTQAFFHAQARIPGMAADFCAVSQDLPTPGYANRFHYLASEAEFTPYDGWTAVTVFSDGAGNMWTLIKDWGWIELHPLNHSVAKQMAEVTAFETRLQHVTVTEHEILIEEPK